MKLAEDAAGFFIPSINLFGIGAHKEIGREIKLFGAKRPLIVTDEGLVNAGIVNELTNIIKKDSLVDISIYDKVHPNPTDKDVDAGLKIYKESHCDMIITIGGGSSHDCGKGIGLLATNGGRIHDYEGIDKSKKAMPPFIAVTTTSGTASEMTRFCIITDSSRKVKMAIVDRNVTPNVSIVDPILMKGMPKGLTAATGMDALTHAVEAYVSTAANPITDACALKAISLISENLRSAYANGDDMLARDNMAYAQYLAGMAFNNASLGYVHAMAHQLGGFYDLPHGVCNAILLPHVERFNLISKVSRFVNIAIAMGQSIGYLSDRDAAEKAIEAIEKLSMDVGIPEGLSKLSVKKEDFRAMAENAMKDACGLTNPRIPSIDDVIKIYDNAY
jgi:alcohol dehydrogenase